MKRCLVTGCEGFVGSHLADLLVEKGHRVYGIVYSNHMIDKKDYEAFIWIRENVGDEYEKGILDPWKASAFAAITGKTGWARIVTYPHAGSERAYEFLKEGCTDTALLREKGISIVYTLGECYNPDLVEVRKNIYLLEEDGEDD